MSLSNEPTWRLVENANLINDSYPEMAEPIDKELDLRNPIEAEVYFGDCAGKAVFVPLEPEQDENDKCNPVIEQSYWEDEKGNGVWV